MQGRTRKTLIHSADAQASVVGFVIILGILLAATSLYLGFNVPKWTAEYEFAHEAKVERDFSDLSATIDLALVSEDPTASNSIAIGMAPERVHLVGIFASGGTLQFDPENENFVCVAALPNETAVNESEGRSWNSTPADFSVYDKYHVETSLGEGAKLQLSAGGDGNYSGGEEYLNGEFWFINFTVTNNTTLYTHWLTVHAKNIVIGPNSSINADGSGMAGGKCVGYPNLSEPGQGEGGGGIPNCRHPNPPPSRPNDKYCYCGAGGGGAGHYSEGGDGGWSYTGKDRWCTNCGEQNHSGGAGGSTYGNATDISTADAGSGGATAGFGQRTTAGCCFEGGFGGDGGGVIHLDALTITIIGNVSVNGEEGHYSKDLDRAWDSAGGGGGGGSGGTILLKGTTITIFGNLSAKGGKGADGALSCDHSTSVYDSNGGGGGGGSGGVIKIFYGDNLSAPGGLTYHTNVSGGAGGNGGVGKSDGCSSSTTPEAGGNGSRGGDGLNYPKPYPEYAESVPHHPSGYLISNVTALHGSIGYPASKTSIIRYGNMTWGEYTPSGTSIALKVRTSMNASMSDALPWEECPEVTMGNIADLPSVSNGHRYIQWRADLVTLDRSRTPKLMWVNISYEYERPVLMNATGNIEFGSQYLYHPDYKLNYEHGAIIKEPSQGTEFMLLSPPLIIAQDANNCTSLIISAFNLTGTESSSSGAFSSSIAAYYQSSVVRKGGLTRGLAYGNLTLTLTTEHFIAWKDWFNETCKDAGLTRGNTTVGDYYFDEAGNNTLHVIFTGNESKPVYLWLKCAEARIEIPKLPKRA